MNQKANTSEAQVTPGSLSEAGEISFLGLTLHPRTISELNELVARGVRERKKWVIANHNLHSVYLFHRSSTLREFYANAHCIHIDGMPLVALGGLYGHTLERTQRVTYADWTHPLMQLAAEQGWRVFYLGSPEGVAAKAAQTLGELYPSLHMETASGYFNARAGSEENEAVIAQINAFAPDVLMVGMGMPRQELWIHENLARLDAHVILPSGAAMDYIAGAVATPPRWMGRVGLEWAYRFIQEPRRLFSRYLIEPWYILILLCADFVRKGGKLKAPASR